jgi:hypothetical protein
MRNCLTRSLIGSVLAIAACAANAEGPNKVVGTWLLISSTISPKGIDVYGPEPKGQLIFTEQMRYSAILFDPRVPRFASGMRDKGSAEENQLAMAGGFATYGEYSVDGNGDFSGISVEGSTFPNSVGLKRSRDQMSMAPVGDRMTETTQLPGGSKLINVWERAD